jgi:hypothetical protein
MRTFSNTDKSGKISVIWNVRTRPSATRLAAPMRSIGLPSNQISPAVAGKKPLIRLNRVVLPAPFGPMTP